MGPNVLVEAGAGYFIEKSNKDAVTYCERKSAHLKDNCQKVAEYINQKKMQMGKV
jgi:prefoldin subunit 5